MNIRFVDLAASHAEMAGALEGAFKQTIKNSGFIGGAAVEAFEERWAQYCGTKHAVGVANGTDALTLGLRAMGIGPGDDVIVPANTFIATAEAVALVGASPIFVDVDDATLLLDPSIVEAAISPRTAAVIAVHLYGQTCDMDALDALCRRHGMALVEDACQAHGATWTARRAGSFGVFAAFSFYPGKNLGALGDAGAVVTDDAELAARIRSLADHGRGHPDPSRHVVATNSRLDALQALLLDRKLDHLDRWNNSRKLRADTYTRLLGDVASVRITAQQQEADSVHHLYVIRTEARAALRDHLNELGIQTGIHYDVPCHHHPAFRRNRAEALPVAEQAAANVLSLPMHPHLTDDEVGSVAAAVRRFTSTARVGATA